MRIRLLRNFVYFGLRCILKGLAYCKSPRPTEAKPLGYGLIGQARLPEFIDFPVPLYRVWLKFSLSHHHPHKRIVEKSKTQNTHRPAVARTASTNLWFSMFTPTK